MKSMEDGLSISLYGLFRTFVCGFPKSFEGSNAPGLQVPKATVTHGH